MKKNMIDELTIGKAHSSAGVGMVELVIVVTIIVIASTFAAIGISRSRNSMNLQNSARTFASYVEKARVDAIRRHEPTNVDITGPNTYSVQMAFDGTDDVRTRTFTLEKGVRFVDSTNTPYTVSGVDVIASNGEDIPKADFNWRGRTSICSTFFRMRNSNNEGSAVQVAGSGDVTIDTGVYSPAAVTTASVSPTADIAPSAVVAGGFSHYQIDPCGVSGGAAPPIVPPVATCAGGSIRANTGSVSVRKNGGSTASVNITVTGPGTITAAPNQNLQVTPTSRSVTSSTGGTFAFSVTSITRTRASNPPFTVTFSNPCSSLTLYVTVVN